MELLFENWRQYLNEEKNNSSELYGNCGMLAVALLEEGIRRGKEVEVVFLHDAEDPIEDEDYDLYHVAIYYDGKYYDDRGEVSRDQLGDIISMKEGEDYNLDAYIVKNENGLSTVLDKVEHLTNWSKTCEEYKERAVNFWNELLKDEDLYYGTSTVFQEEIIKNGIKSPSKWGNYGFAESCAKKIVEDYGGEPMVVQMSYNDFNKDYFKLDESYKNVKIYAETFLINLEAKHKLNL